MAARLISIACILFGGLLYWAALGSDTPKAYFFPQMLALAMVAMGAAMLVMDFRSSGKRQAAGHATQWYKIWPGMVVLVVFMAIAEPVGFYVSSWLAFTSIGVLYAPAGDASGNGQALRADRYCFSRRALPRLLDAAARPVATWVSLSDRREDDNDKRFKDYYADWEWCSSLVWRSPRRALSPPTIRTSRCN